jgi:hypothetical protein
MKARKNPHQLQSVETEEWLTVSLKTLAQLLDAHRGSVRRWLRDAGIHPVALGRGRNSAMPMVLIDGKPWHHWLVKAVYQRLLEELGKLDVQVNPDKTRVVDLTQEGSFGFLGFTFRRAKTLRGVWGVRFGPKMKARTALLQKLKEIFRRFESQPVARVIELVNRRQAQSVYREVTRVTPAAARARRSQRGPIRTPG